MRLLVLGRAASRGEEGQKLGDMHSARLVRGEYCSSSGRERCMGRGCFSPMAWSSFCPDEKQEQYLDVLLPFSDRIKLAWLFRGRHITVLG